MPKEKNPKPFAASSADGFVINPRTINQRFVIPNVCSIDLDTGEVELYTYDVSEAARQFWEAVKRIAGGR